ncbi:HD domain-containing protein [Candidatus Micrarchaeota archaeon]|nr:HD domain-containing protein [Candidatus Micrarchaeota archaeon]
MESVTKYIYEAGMLKRVARSGWWAEKVKQPESVADHCFRAAIIGFLLARMEGKSEDIARKICTALVFHDMHETRIQDLNKIAAGYVDVKGVGKKIEEDQAAPMPEEIRKSVLGVLELTEDEETIKHDADALECAFQAKEYAEIGHAGAQSWIENIGPRLKTKSGKEIYEKLKTTSSNSWWEGLKKID